MNMYILATFLLFSKVSTPKYECDVIFCNVELPNVYLNCLSDLVYDRRNKKHFEVLHFICHKSCYVDSLLKSDWSFWKSGVPLIRVYMTQSSAKSLTVDLMLFGKSLMYIRKCRGPSAVPWSIYDLTWIHSEFPPSTTTLCSLLVRKVIPQSLML